MALFVGTLVIGAFGDDDVGVDAGAAYLFRFDGAQWRQMQKMVAWDGMPGDQFGFVLVLYPVEQAEGEAGCFEAFGQHEAVGDRAGADQHGLARRVSFGDFGGDRPPFCLRVGEISGG